MLQLPRYVQNIFTVHIPRNPTIDRFADNFYERLKDHYFAPQALGIPVEVDPEIPRLIFPSQHGFSQIHVSQSTISLNVQYSPDWQRDIGLGNDYLEERISLIFDLLEVLSIPALFSGISTLVMRASDDEARLLRGLARLYSGNLPSSPPHDINIKVSRIVDDDFFSNVTIRNYRSYQVSPNRMGMIRMSDKDAVECGLEIAVDVNDRRAFNERTGYESSRTAAEQVTSLGIREAKSVVEMAEEESW